MKYIVLDAFGHVVRSFKTYSEAQGYRFIAQRPDWVIRRMSYGEGF
jgi:hypothetical protein